MGESPRSSACVTHSVFDIISFLSLLGKIVSIVSDEEVFALGRLLNVVSVEARDIVG